LSLHGNYDYVRKGGLGRNRPDYAGNQALTLGLQDLKMSGMVSGVRFLSSEKARTKTNDFIGSTPKPDRITEGQRGWNLEPQKGISRSQPRRRKIKTTTPMEYYLGTKNRAIFYGLASNRPKGIETRDMKVCH
jgi:hypothetical protein